MVSQLEQGHDAEKMEDDSGAQGEAPMASKFLFQPSRKQEIGRPKALYCATRSIAFEERIKSVSFPVLGPEHTLLVLLHTSPLTSSRAI